MSPFSREKIVFERSEFDEYDPFLSDMKIAQEIQQGIQKIDPQKSPLLWNLANNSCQYLMGGSCDTEQEFAEMLAETRGFYVELLALQ